MGCRVGDIAALMEEIAPTELAEEGDNVGLLIGDPGSHVERVLITLDVTGEVVREAIRREAGMVISHHPLIYRPLRGLVAGDPVAELAMEIIRNGISLYSAHTNLDACRGGVSDALAASLGLKEARPLRTSPGTFFKLVTFVPGECLGPVREALFEAGAGVIGRYARCSFYSPGVGTFLPGEGSSPYLGEEGREERAEEYRLEVLVEGRRLAAAVSALKKAHPYEEPAVDVYRLDNEGRVGASAGLGRVGALEKPLTLSELAERCRKALGCERVRVFGERDRSVGRVAVCGGRGGFLVPVAAREADVLVTGDVDHHQALDALARGLALLDAGHYHTEKPVLAQLREDLREAAAERGFEVEFLVSEVETFPEGMGDPGL